MASPSLRVWIVSSIVILAVPSNTCTKASNGAECLLNCWSLSKAKNVIFNFTQNDEYIEIEYIDDGLGLDNAIIVEDSIFEMGVTTTKGSGLGLYHIKEILEEMNHSTISVYKLDKGIKFLLRLKL